ncbi:multidrug efflux system subunit MdtC [Salmonella enterica subsp. enterica]|nr:multidrug efflux system subunit MdtC [Salmonella enterica subsp. enterica]
MKIIRDDPAVNNVTGFTGGSRVNSGMMFITLKPRGERKETAQQIIDRLRAKLAKETRRQAVSDGGTGYSRRRAAG